LICSIPESSPYTPYTSISSRCGPHLVFFIAFQLSKNSHLGCLAEIEPGPAVQQAMSCAALGEVEGVGGEDGKQGAEMLPV